MSFNDISYFYDNCFISFYFSAPFGSLSCWCYGHCNVRFSDNAQAIYEKQKKKQITRPYLCLISNEQLNMKTHWRLYFILFYIINEAHHALSFDFNFFNRNRKHDFDLKNWTEWRRIQGVILPLILKSNEPW